MGGEPLRVQAVDERSNASLYLDPVLALALKLHEKGIYHLVIQSPCATSFPSLYNKVSALHMQIAYVSSLRIGFRIVWIPECKVISRGEWGNWEEKEEKV